MKKICGKELCMSMRVYDCLVAWFHIDEINHIIYEIYARLNAVHETQIIKIYHGVYYICYFKQFISFITFSGSPH